MNIKYEEHATKTKILHLIYMDKPKLTDKKGWAPNIES